VLSELSTHPDAPMKANSMEMKRRVMRGCVEVDRMVSNHFGLVFIGSWRTGSSISHNQTHLLFIHNLREIDNSTEYTKGNT
jgi:hypothetical protein